METNQQSSNNQSQPSQAEPQVQEEAKTFADQFARVNKQEKFLAEERKRIDEAKKTFETDKHDVERYRGLKGKDPFEILEHFGVSYEQLVEADKNRRTTPMDPVAKKALETVEQLRLELESKEKEAEKARHSRAEVKLMSDIDTVIRSNEFDLIEKLGEQNAVRDFMEEMYQQTGEIPDIKDACEAINNSIALKFNALKGSKWLNVQQAAEEVSKVPQADYIPKKPAVLSNKMSQSTVHNDSKPLTEKDRIKAAIAAMNAVKSK